MIVSVPVLASTALTVPCTRPCWRTNLPKALRLEGSFTSGVTRPVLAL